jgi:hypothetical protein
VGRTLARRSHENVGHDLRVTARTDDEHTHVNARFPGTRASWPRLVR